MTPDHDQKRILRLLTLNTLCRGDVRARLTAIGAFLADQRYDVVCLQEVIYRRHLELLSPQGISPYPHRAAHGSIALAGGLGVLSAHPLRDPHFHFFPPTRPVRREYLMRKGTQQARVTVDGRGLVVVTSHLTANRDNDWNPENRYARAQVVELHRLARVLAELDPALPLVVAGDLNMPPDAPAFLGFLARTGLHRVPTGGTYRPVPGFLNPPVFDHVLARGAGGSALTATARTVLREEQVRVPGERSAYLSDHYGIELTLALDELPSAAQ